MPRHLNNCGPSAPGFCFQLPSLCAATLVLASCASPAFHKNGKPEPLTLSEANASVRDIVGAVETDYVDAIERSVLVDRCAASIDRQYPDSHLTASHSPASFQEIDRMLSSLPAGGLESALEACTNGMVAETDQKTGYLDPERFAEFAGKGGDVAGIGVELRTHAEGIEVVGAIEGGPADLSGIQHGDAIVEIDKSDVRGLGVGEVVRRLRGPVGSLVDVVVQRGGESEPRHFAIKRQVVRVESVEGRILRGQIAYFRVTRLSENLLPRFVSLALRLRAENKGIFKGLILDLRPCVGGLLKSSVGLAAVFLPKGTPIVESRGRSEFGNRQFRAVFTDYANSRTDPLISAPSDLKSVPMVVLIGPTTAAGAEVAAASFQDNHRAVLVGSRSCGSGTVQTVIPLSIKKASAVKLTSGRLYRITGRPIGDALDPDYAIKDTEIPKTNLRRPVGTQGDADVTGADTAIEKALQILEGEGSLD